MRRTELKGTSDHSEVRELNRMLRELEDELRQLKNQSVKPRGSEKVVPGGTLQVGKPDGSTLQLRFVEKDGFTENGEYTLQAFNGKQWKTVTLT